ncbi:MAG: metallophosphoesterase family protein, partial [Solirubrobacterales bacterium]
MLAAGLAVLAGVVLLLTGTLAIASRAQARVAPLIAAAGDIACAPINGGYNDGEGNALGCRQKDTAELLAQKPYAAVLPLGDLVNGEDVSLDAFLTAYEPTWGRFRAISHPAIGNHEYDDWAGATGYWDYWNGVGVVDGAAGVRGQGWYAYDVGPWRLIALNSNCTLVGCYYSSDQGRWLRRELKRNSDR